MLRRRKTHLHACLIGGVSLLVPFIGSAARAQATEGVASDVPPGEIVVTGSRINLQGYSQPTPVTVVGAQLLERDALAGLGSALQRLPAFGNANSPDTSQGAQDLSRGVAGVSQVNLRNLGAGRTLVLLNSNRIVTAAIGSVTVTGPDLNMIPDSLIKRVDVVTGGASAAWGSDAVAGVVNIVMDNDFRGVKANAEYGFNDWGNKRSYKAQLSLGTSLGDRGHVVVGLTYLNQPKNPLYSQAKYFPKGGFSAFVANPLYTATNGQPQFVTVHNAGLATATAGGLIVGNAAGTGGLNANVLRGIQFIGAGTPTAFNFGTVYAGGLSVGGSALAPAYEGENGPLSVPIKNFAAYTQAYYDLTDHIKISLELEAGRSKVRNSSLTYQPTVTILRDNAFIPASVAAIMTANGIPSFNLGTTNFNNYVPGENPLNSPEKSSGTWSTSQTRNFYRAVVGLDGDLGGGWSWTARYQHSSNRNHIHIGGAAIVANYNRAIDAVFVTPTNVGASGLPLGSIQCRSTLSNPANGCIPLNLFGQGVASQAAINYVVPSIDSGQAPQAVMLARQDTVSGSLQGELPLGLPAGKPAITAGFDYRNEYQRQTSTALGLAGAYSVGNFGAFSGKYHTWEGFTEVNVPLLEDTLVDSLSFNAAGRITHYSTSGSVKTWKLGLVSQIIPDIRLRGSWSRDVRAPSIAELFQPLIVAAAGSGTLPTGQIVNTANGGNPDLKPEAARTITAGIVFTPRWIPGLNLSVDWYSISLKKAVYTPTVAQIYNQCVAGSAVYCAQEHLTNGVITQVDIAPINAASELTRGIDFQMDYTRQLFGGRMTVSAMGSYVQEQKITSAVGVRDIANSMQFWITGDSGPPKFRATVRATYEQGPVSVTAQTRIVGSTKDYSLYHEGSGPNSVDNNSIPAIAYLDLRGSWAFGKDRALELYGAVDNLLDKDPPVVPYGIGQAQLGFYPTTNPNFYDMLGRTYRVGVRARF